jgi:hypothetical protein
MRGSIAVAPRDARANTGTGSITIQVPPGAAYGITADVGAVQARGIPPLLGFAAMAKLIRADLGELVDEAIVGAHGGPA